MADFAFKDFVVRQDSSPLKVNTDAILLGAAVRKLPHNAKVLEVGMGNGTIALLPFEVAYLLTKLCAFITHSFVVKSIL